MSSNFFHGGEHLEQGLAPEPFARPAAGAVLLHCGIVIAIVLYGVIGGFFQHSLWGGAGPGGAIQVNITSALPLPTDHPPNQNVLATEKPSEAPAPPQPKVKQAEDQTAIPIQGKPKKQQQEEVKKTPPRQTPPVPQNRAQYGEQAGSSMPKTMAQGAGTGPTSVTDANFGSLFGWYVDNINRKMEANGYRSLVVTGKAELSHEDADAHIDKLAKKYLDADSYPFRKEGEQRVIVRVTPNRIEAAGLEGEEH